MGKGSKILYWAGAGAAFLLVLLLAVAVIVPRVIDSAWLKETIQTEVAKQVNGEFNFQNAEISILPVSFVALQQVSLNIPETAEINLDTIKVYPKLLPLLTGNIELDKIVIDTPAFSLPLPKKSGGKHEQKKTFSLSGILETASSKLSPILSASGLEVGVHKVTLRLIDGDEQIFLFEDIEGTFDVNTKSLTATVSCESNIWESMELKASFAPGSMNGKGKISLENMNSKMLVSYFLTDEHPLSEGLVSSLQVNFSVSPESGLTASIKSSGSSFTTLHEDKKITAEVGNLKASMHHRDEFSSLTVEELTLSYPQVQLSGSFTFDRTIPHVGLDINSQNSDIRSLYEVLPVFLNAIYGDMPVVEEIFNITRGGLITEASLHIEGKSPADLAVFESMLIKGPAENAAISLADLGVSLQGVPGDVIIAYSIC